MRLLKAIVFMAMIVGLCLLIALPFLGLNFGITLLIDFAGIVAVLAYGKQLYQWCTEMFID